MKVICIDANYRQYSIPSTFNVSEGETYTVSNFEVVNNTPCYSLFEDSDNTNLWAADRFIPVSEIDETEMIREYKTEPLCV